MYKNIKILAIVPARKNSKGLKGKNIKHLLGKPLISYTIEESLKSKYIDKIFVSTDCIKAAEISLAHGVDSKPLRPNHLARGMTSSIDVMEYEINRLKQDGESYDVIIMLEPTSPLRQSFDIDNCIEMLVDNYEAKSITSVSEKQSDANEFTVNLKNNFLDPDSPSKLNAPRRQDINKTYYYEGSIYASYVDTLLALKTFYHEKTLCYIMPKWKSLEIDDIVDFVCIESLMKNKDLFK